VCHVAAPEWAKSVSIYHVSQPYWSMSEQVGPTMAESNWKWAPQHDTWHSLIGLHQQPFHQTETHDTILLVQTYTCQQGRGNMAAPQATTSSDACHVAAYHEVISPSEVQQLDTCKQFIGPRQHMWSHCVPCGTHRVVHSK
jgi:hypothetical protein